jgi:acyl-CoA thioester hydrolase
MANEGVEVWRGGVDSWECDSMGHLNVRFYVARATEGMTGLAAALGMTGAFTEAATATLAVREHHIRFAREARPDAALHMTAGVLDVFEDSLQALFLLVHSGSGEISAAIQARLCHVTPHDGVAFPWPERIRTAAESLRLELPERMTPRSLTPGGPPPSGSLARALDLKLPVLSAGAVLPQHCDVFGRLLPEEIMARISDGYFQFANTVRTVSGEGAGRGGPAPRIGAAAVEMRLAYAAWPRAGDRIEMRSGIKTATPKVQTLVHWLLDPTTGQPWAAAEHVVVALDLDARRHADLPPAALEALRSRTIPGLAV